MALLSILGSVLLLSPTVAPLPQVAGFEPPTTGDPMGPSKWRPTTELEMRLYDIYGDFHVAVVGEEIITRFDVFRLLGSPQFEDPTADQPNMTPQVRQARQASAALSQLIEQRLKIQGGRAQGYEEELLNSQLEQTFRNRIEQLGGPQTAARLLKRDGITPQDFKDQLGDGLMASLWERSVTGRIPGSTGRISVDSFIRPGKQWARYREYVESGRDAENAIVGRARTGKLTLQRIVLLVNRGGKPPEDVKREVETLRSRITDGVLTFEEAVQNFAPPELQGAGSIIRDAGTMRVSESFQLDFTSQTEEVATFVEGAAAGEISPVLEFNKSGFPQGYVLLKVLDRTMATEALPFESLELQTKLRQEIAREASEVRVSRGLAELVQTTHLAPEQLRRDFLQNGRRFRTQ